LVQGFGFLPRALGVSLKKPRVFLLSLLWRGGHRHVPGGLGVPSLAPARALTEGWLGDGSGWRGALGIGLAVLVYLAMLAATWLTVPAVLLAPLQDPLSEAVEAALGNFQPLPSRWRGRARCGVAVSHTALRLLLQVLGYLVLFPLNFIPVVGSVVWAAVSSVWTMWWLSGRVPLGPDGAASLPVRAGAEGDAPPACSGAGVRRRSASALDRPGGEFFSHSPGRGRGHDLLPTARGAKGNIER